MSLRRRLERIENSARVDPPHEPVFERLSDGMYIDTSRCVFAYNPNMAAVVMDLPFIQKYSESEVNQWQH